MEKVEQKAREHLNELGAYDVPNPIIAKAITMQRLTNGGVSEADALRAISQAMRPNFKA